MKFIKERLIPPKFRAKMRSKKGFIPPKLRFFRSQGGEIATILTLAVLAVIGMSTFLSSHFLKNKATTKTMARTCSSCNITNCCDSACSGFDDCIGDVINGCSCQTPGVPTQPPLISIPQNCQPGRCCQMDASTRQIIPGSWGQNCVKAGNCDIKGGCNPNCCATEKDCPYGSVGQTCGESDGKNNGYCQTNSSCDWWSDYSRNAITPTPPKADACSGRYYTECCAAGFENHVCQVGDNWYCDYGTGQFNTPCQTQGNIACLFPNASCKGSQREQLPPEAGKVTPQATKTPTNTDCENKGYQCFAKSGNQQTTCINAVDDTSKPLSYSCGDVNKVCCSITTPKTPTNTDCENKGYHCFEKYGSQQNTCINAVDDTSKSLSYSCGDVNKVCCSISTQPPGVCTCISGFYQGTGCTTSMKGEPCSKATGGSTSPSTGGSDVLQKRTVILELNWLTIMLDRIVLDNSKVCDVNVSSGEREECRTASVTQTGPTTLSVTYEVNPGKKEVICMRTHLNPFDINNPTSKEDCVPIN